MKTFRVLVHHSSGVRLMALFQRAVTRKVQLFCVKKSLSRICRLSVGYVRRGTCDWGSSGRTGRLHTLSSVEYARTREQTREASEPKGCAEYQWSRVVIVYSEARTAAVMGRVVADGGASRGTLIAQSKSRKGRKA